jgi:TonB family protein
MTAVLFLLAGVGCGLLANGQATQQEIAARLVGQPLYLRGLWARDNMKFEADGQPETATAAVPFTESGIDVRSVQLKDGSLVIEGQRMALEFVSKDTIQRVPAKAENYKGKLTLEIESDASGNYDKALNAIFTSDLTSLIPSLPPYWQSYAKGHFCKLKLVEKKPKEKKQKKVSGDATALNATGSGPCLPAMTDAKAAAPALAADGGGKAEMKHVGGTVRPPKVLKSFDPSFTPLARALKHSGMIEVYLIVERDGSISHVSIVKPAGLGLDEEAVASVEKYQFAPATQDETLLPWICISM